MELSSLSSHVQSPAAQKFSGSSGASYSEAPKGGMKVGRIKDPLYKDHYWGISHLPSPHLLRPPSYTGLSKQAPSTSDANLEDTNKGDLQEADPGAECAADTVDTPWLSQSMPQYTGSTGVGGLVAPPFVACLTVFLRQPRNRSASFQRRGLSWA